MVITSFVNFEEILQTKYGLTVCVRFLEQNCNVKTEIQKAVQKKSCGRFFKVIQISEAASGGVLLKKVFLRILQHYQEKS